MVALVEKELRKSGLEECLRTASRSWRDISLFLNLLRFYIK